MRSRARVLDGERLPARVPGTRCRKKWSSRSSRSWSASLLYGQGGGCAGVGRSLEGHALFTGTADECRTSV